MTAIEEFKAERLSGLLDISVAICTLNEEKNIGDCIDSILTQNPKEIIVIDGGSIDNTRKIAEAKGARVINAGRKGLAYQRKVGVESATQEYIALIDADHRPEKGCFRTLIEELEANNYDGIEAQILSVSNSTYWDWAMEQNFKLSHNLPGSRIMIGTPCIYRSGVLKKFNFDPFFTGPSDDTDLCYRLVKAGHRLGVGTPKVFQKHRSDFRSFRKKWIWYGKGDAQFAWRHPERTLSILKHELFNYPVKKSFIALKGRQAKVVPFFVLCGFFRHLGFLKEATKMIFGKRVDADIYST